MTARSADNRVSELVALMPSFSVISRDERSTTVKGNYHLYAEYEGVLLSGNYSLEIEVPSDYPSSLPVVFETAGIIPSNYEHKYTNGALCLGIGGEIATALTKNGSLVHFLDTYVRDALYSAKFFERYGRYPFGDRAHGMAGILSYYAETFATDDEGAYNILECIALDKYRGHLNCPCGSGLKGRDCHGPDIIAVIKSSARRNAATADFKYVAAEIEMRR